MSAFDKVIGYTQVKHELMQTADTLKNREIYEALGVSSPRGLLLHGVPGVGKTLMAQCLIEESGYTDVYLHGDSTPLSVKETPEQIMNLLLE